MVNIELSFSSQRIKLQVDQICMLPFILLTMKASLSFMTLMDLLGVVLFNQMSLHNLLRND